MAIVAGLLGWLVGCAGTSSQMAPVVRPGGADYIVKKGDNLYGIAFSRGVRMQDVVAWNNISNPNLIHPGQRLHMSPPTAGVGGGAVVESRPLTAKPSAPIVSAVPPRVAVTSKPVVVSKPAAVPITAATTVVSKPRQAKPPVAVAKPVSKPATKPVSNPVARSSAPSRVLDGVRWSWPAKGRILKGFSASSEGKKGVDIGGSEGQTVIAAADGKIVYSGSGLRGYGQLIIIEHNKKYLSAYAHNSVLRAKEGDRVTRGQPIAEMGKTGTSRVMLHFEIRRDGKAVDPVRYLPAPSP